MKTIVFLSLLTLAIIGCNQPAVSFIYRSSGESEHFSSAVKTHFGALHVWTGTETMSSSNIGFIPASDSTEGTRKKYILIVTRRVNGASLFTGRTLDDFAIEHGVSLSDSDARELSSALNVILQEPQNDSSYFRYSCNANLDVTPSTVTTNARGRSVVTTGTGSVPTWVTTCELTYYLGAGNVTFADGTTWTWTYPLVSDDIANLKSELDAAISDLHAQN